MSISSAITTAQQRVASAYTAVSDKGGTLPATQNLTNLPTAINSIQTGGGSSKYGCTMDNMLGSVNASGVLQLPTSPSSITFTGVQDIGANVMKYKFYNAEYLSCPVSFPDLESVSGSSGCYYMFSGCTGITSADLSALTTISGSSGCSSMFASCTSLTSVDLSALETIGSYGCQYMFKSCTGITSAGLYSLTTIGSYGCSYMFSGCTGITSADLSALTTIDSSGCASMFYNCTRLTSTDLSALTTIGGSGCAYMFSNCTRLTSVDLSALTTIDNSGCDSMFPNCTSLQSVDLSALTTISGSKGCVSMFYNCKGIQNIYFRALTTSSFGSYVNQFQSMMQGTGTTTTHTIHFPSNIESTIQGLTGYPLFGGTSGYVVLAYDLPATS